MGLSPTYDVLKKIGLPNKPIFTDDKLDNLNLSKIIGTAQRHLGLNIFINFYISEDVRDTTQNRMMIEQIAPGFSEKYLMDPIRFKSEIYEYKRYVKSMVELAGMGNKSIEFADEILEFSTAIAKIMATVEERRGRGHFLHDITVNELQQMTDLRAVAWNWTQYLEAVFENTDVIIDTNTDHVIVMDLAYLQQLPNLLAVTPRATLGIYPNI